MTSTNPPNIPTADNPGGTGLQVLGPVNEADSSEPMAGILSAFDGIAESQPNALGGNVSRQLVHGTIAAYQSELRTARVALEKARGRCEVLQEDLSAERQRTSTLRAQADDLKRQRNFANLCMTLATILAGLAVDAYKSGAERIALCAGGIALALVIGAWVIPRINGTRQ